MEVEPGNATSSLGRARIGPKADATTVILTVKWGMARWIFEADLISFHGA